MTDPLVEMRARAGQAPHAPRRGRTAGAFELWRVTDERLLLELPTIGAARSALRDFAARHGEAALEDLVLARVRSTGGAFVVFRGAELRAPASPDARIPDWWFTLPPSHCRDCGGRNSPGADLCRPCSNARRGGWREPRPTDRRDAERLATILDDSPLLLLALVHQVRDWYLPRLRRTILASGTEHGAILAYAAAWDWVRGRADAPLVDARPESPEQELVAAMRAFSVLSVVLSTLVEIGDPPFTEAQHAEIETGFDLWSVCWHHIETFKRLTGGPRRRARRCIA